MAENGANSGINQKQRKLLQLQLNLMSLACKEWIRQTSRGCLPDPPKPEEVELTLRSNTMQYTDFADRMIRAVHGKSQFGDKATKKEFGSLVSVSQEAFALLLYRNGYDNWVYMHNELVTSDESTCPRYKYTERTVDLTSRNGGWSSEGMTLFNKLYKKVQEDRRNDHGDFDKIYKAHWIETTRYKKKRKQPNGGDLQLVVACDDIGDILEPNGLIAV